MGDVAVSERTAVPTAFAARRTRRALLFAVLAALAGPTLAHGASLKIAWTANTEPDVTGYKVHYGLASGAYISHLDVGNTVSWTVPGLQDAKTYYFAVTAYDSFGNESGYSGSRIVAMSFCEPRSCIGRLSS